MRKSKTKLALLALYLLLGLVTLTLQATDTQLDGGDPFGGKLHLDGGSIILGAELHLDRGTIDFGLEAQDHGGINFGGELQLDRSDPFGAELQLDAPR